MSTSIDERIVDMQFNNQQFESGIQSSLGSLEKLKKGLDLDGASKSLSNLGAAGKGFSLAGIAEGVDTIASKFTALGIIGITALNNITNKAIDAGIQLVKSLTLDPIMSGLSEYETKINAITTILTNTASKGTTIDQVNVALSELNEYADKTIYNFGEMARNIGTFTAAGIDLDTSVGAIKGIANLAAGSGSSAQQASTAMYQLSQALGAGTLRLQDWNSVVNAGMGGELFKQALIDTGKELGKTVPKMENFRTSLQDGWITTEVLTKTLNKLAQDESLLEAATQVKTFTQLLDTMKESVQSGWAVSWEHIIGDKEEAAKVLTGVSQAFESIMGPISDARNEMLSFWADNGGRDAVIQSFTNAFEGLGSVIKPIKEAFREFFPPMTGEKLVAFSQGLKELTENFKIGEETSDKLRRTFAGLFAALDLIRQGAGFVVNVIGEVFSLFGGSSIDGILDITASFGDFIVALNDGARAGDVFKKAFDNVKKFLGEIIETFSGFGEIDLGPLTTFSEKVEERFKPFQALGKLVKDAFEVILKVFERVAPIFATLGSIIGSVFGSIAEAVGNAVENMEFNGILDLINTGLFGALLLGIKKFIDSLTDITSGASGFLDSITGILDGVRGSLEAYQSSLKAKTLLTIAGAIAILAGALFVLSLIPGEKLATALTGITVLFVELAAIMLVLSKNIGSSKLGAAALQMIAIAAAILILSFAMKNLAQLDWEGVLKGAVGVGTLSAILVKSADVLSKNSSKLISGGLGLIAFSAAIVILTQAVEQLGALDIISLTKGLVGVGILVTELALFMKATNLEKMSIGKGIGLITLAAAIKILASAVGDFGALDTGALIKGLAAMGVVLAELAIFMKLTGDSKHVISTALGMIALGAAMLIFAEAVERMGSLSWEQIGKGLITMAGALGIVAIAVNVMPKNMIGTGVGLIAVSAALLILGQALQTMGNMSWEEIAKSLVLLAGSLLIIVVAMKAMTGGIAGAAAMLIMAAAITALVPALMMLGSMELDEIGRALLALVGVFAIVGVAGLVLGPLTPVILALAAAIAILGAGVLATGAGLLAFSAGLSALAIAGTAGAAALVVIVTSLLSLIPMALTKIGEGIIAFAGVIANGTPAIMEAVKAIALGLIQLLVEVTPPVVAALLTFLVTLLEKLAETIPKMVDAGMKLLLGILQGISDNIFEIVVVALKIISEFLRGIAEGIPGVATAGVDVIVAFLTAIGQETPRIIDAGFKMIIDFGNGLAEAIEENTGPLVEAFGKLAGAMIQGLVDGIFAGIGSGIDAIKNLGSGLIDGFKDVLGIHSPSTEFKDASSYVIGGAVKGIDEGIGKAQLAGQKLGMALETGFKSNSEVYAQTGNKYALDFANGISNNQTSANTAGKAVTISAEEGLKYNLPVYGQTGDKYGIDFVTNLSNKQTAANTAGRDVSMAAEEGIKSNVDEFYKAGEAAGEGFTEGLISMIKKAQAAAAKFAQQAQLAAQASLKIKSPSRVFRGLGVFSGQGFIDGLTSMIGEACKSSKEMASSAITSMQDAISKIADVVNSDIDSSPVITPVLDMSDIQKGASAINQLFGNKTLNVSGSRVMASQVSDQIAKSQTPVSNTSDGKKSDGGTSYEFIQNNYSPKALTRLEIYRQTKNQFSQMKGLVEGV